MSQKLLFLLFAVYCSSGMSWRQIIALSGAAIAGFLYLIYHQQEKILYLNETIPPKRTSQNPSPFANPSQQGMDYEDIWLTAADSTKLHAWWIPAPNSNSDAPTLLFFHANAGNMGFRLPNLLSLHQKLSVNIFIVSYRGYGESEGVPSEDGIKMDAMSAMSYVSQRIGSAELCGSRLFVFGRSLGGAVAIYAVSEWERKGGRVAGMAMENTFTSISDMVGKVFPFLDFEIVKQNMLKIHWRSIDRIGGIRAKMLFLASTNDEIVPHPQMLKLHREAKAAKSKELFVIEGGMHNDGWVKGGEEYWRRLHDFINS